MGVHITHISRKREKIRSILKVVRGWVKRYGEKTKPPSGSLASSVHDTMRYSTKRCKRTRITHNLKPITNTLH